MDGKIPAEGLWIEGGARNVERHTHLPMQPPVDKSNRFFLSSGDELWERRKMIVCYNFRHRSLLA
jgi:hypothetical protein